MQRPNCCGMPYGQHSVGCSLSPSYSFYFGGNSNFTPSQSIYGRNTSVTQQSLNYGNIYQQSSTNYGYSNYDTPTGLNKNKFGGNMVTSYHTLEELGKRAAKVNSPLIARELYDDAINERQHEKLYNPRIQFSDKGHEKAVDYLNHKLPTGTSTDDYNTQLERFEREIYGEKFEQYRS